MNTAIIVAAGSGSRFGLGQPKQFLSLAGKPVIIHTLEKFQACHAIDEIVLVLSEHGRKEFLGLNFEISNLKIVSGGETRTESVRNGLNAIDAATADLIAIHDGARPLVSVDEINSTMKKASQTGAACLVAEVTDTIKHVSGGEIHSTVDRNKLRRALTPQVFRYEIISRAFELYGDDNTATDECYLVEKLGIPVAIIEGNPRNIKITRPEDLAIAEAIMDGNS